MKKIILASGFMAVASFAQFSQAIDGTINFTGSLNAAACTIAGGTNINLEMDSISHGDLPSTPTVAHKQYDVKIDCTGASGLTGVKLKFDPASGSGSDGADSRLLKTEGVAKGASIALLDTSNAIIDLKTGSLDGALTVDDGVGTSTLSLRAAFVKNTEGFVPGDLTARLPFTLTYE